MPRPRPRPPPGKNKSHNKGQGKDKGKRIDAVAALTAKVDAFDPSSSSLTSFSSFPLSSQTLAGLTHAGFTTPTDVQRRCIPPALTGKDLLVTARTGSGKTLAFLVPLLDTLFRHKWGPQDGLGALVISPTRELAVQTFEVLRKIGLRHQWSAGLVMGGKPLKEESDRVARMNILVATPGRLLQQLDMAYGFSMDDLKVLVLDEADRILDLGFSRTIDAILAHLPKVVPDAHGRHSRQTLLFSATKSGTIDALARLSLQDPTEIHVHEDGDFVPDPKKPSPQTAQNTETDIPKEIAIATPRNLMQHYTIVPLHRKLDMLWSFIKTHLKAKCIVFVSCTKQVRYIHRTFSTLQPGTRLLHLHGHQSLTTRLSVFHQFSRSPPASSSSSSSTLGSILISTDLASRGLDFPAVDWVLQLDCPSDADAYIHRVGRTARHDRAGNALLFLSESERKMITRLEERGITIEEVKISEKKVKSIQEKLQALAWRDVEIKYLAQRTFISYVRSIYLQKDKEVFWLDGVGIDLTAYSESMGLVGMPKISFLNGEKKKKAKKPDVEEEGENEGNDEDGKGKGKEKPKTRYDRMFGRTNQGVLSEHYNKIVDHSAFTARAESNSDSDNEEESESDEDFITLTRANHDLLPSEEEELSLPAVVRVQRAKQKTQRGNDAASASSSSLSKIPFALTQPPPLPQLTGTALLTEREAHLSKRALKAGTSKKAMLKSKPGPSTKLAFDESGEAHAVSVWESVDVEANIADRDRDRAVWEEKGKEFVRGLEEKRREEDERDLREAKERKRELKRAKKEKEKAMRRTMSGGGVVAFVGGSDNEGEEGDGGFDFDPEAGAEDGGAASYSEEEKPKNKKRKTTHAEEVSPNAERILKRKRKEKISDDWVGVGEIGGDDLERMALDALNRS